MNTRKEATLRLSLCNIEEASRIIDPVFTCSPQFSSDPLNDQLGFELVHKVETLNPIRSFKGRGADYFVHKLEKNADWLVCASAGNFGQGLAYATAKHGLKLTVFAAETANPLKVERMRRLGAQVMTEGYDFDEAKQAARDYAEKSGARFVEDGRDVSIAEGAGTIGLELSRWPKPFDAVLIPLGNGALLAGVGRWLKAVSPQTRVIGVCARGAPAMERSWRAGRVIATETINTIADGLAVRIPIEEALDDMRFVVDDILLVDDQMILEAMRMLFRELGLVIEPAGAPGVAAAITYRERFAEKLIATILCGGNMTEEQVHRWLFDSL
ncbi:MAG: pyridoxal-phosphate dependent enzyme [Acidobacteria bacterium]|nr:pyridoxal-phosphate dependent enzyme [Acidobacteriota bacterium]